MGYSAKTLDWVSNRVNSHYKGALNISMLELGDQVIDDPTIKEQTGRDYFRNKSYKFLSFDLNGKHGAKKVNLGLVNNKLAWKNAFDVVTNMGTIEHVEPRDAQFNSFLNVHSWVKPGGLMFHSMPYTGNLSRDSRWSTHCRYYYSKEFFQNIAKENDYEIIDCFIDIELIHVCMTKNTNNLFSSNKNLLLSYLHVDSSRGTTIYQGINDGQSKNLLLIIIRKLLDSTRPTREKIGLDKSIITRIKKFSEH